MFLLVLGRDICSNHDKCVTFVNAAQPALRL